MVGTNEDVLWQRRMCAEMGAGLPRALKKMHALRERKAKAAFDTYWQSLAALHEDRTPEGVVYFILCGDAVKIGYTRDLVTRLDGLQTANPTPLKIYGYVPGDLDVEERLHVRLREHRIHREWFHWNDPVKAFVDSIVPACIREQYNG